MLEHLHQSEFFGQYQMQQISEYPTGEMLSVEIQYATFAGVSHTHTHTHKPFNHLQKIVQVMSQIKLRCDDWNNIKTKNKALKDVPYSQTSR